MNKRSWIVCFFSVSVLLLMTGCTVPTRMQTESESVELRNARLVQTEIKMDSGTLKVAGGADNLLDAEFKYNVASWKPEVKYKVKDWQGQLTVEQGPGVRGAPLGTVRNEWNLRFNSDTPMDLEVNLGAGKGVFNLGNVLVSKLSIQSGAGDVQLDMRGNPSLSTLYLNIGAGKATVDLTGKWRRNVNASIKGGIGNATVKLPRDVGVRVSARKGIGKIKTRGLSRQGSTYMNDAYGKSKIALSIDITSGVGEINLETE